MSSEHKTVPNKRTYLNVLILYVIGKTIRMIMTELPLFSSNFAYTIVSNILY